MQRSSQLAGPWRLKELFADGKRRCSIPHRPRRALTETTCDTWRVGELPLDQMPAYLLEVQKVVTAAVLSTIAIPDTMECDHPMALDFRSAAVLASEAYAALRPLVCADVESTRELRRYVGLRWHNPDPDVIATEQPPALVREGHVLHSFVGLEVDLKTGSLAIPLFVPRGIGHSYHAQTHLIQCVIRKAQRDLAQTNLERRASGLDPYPDINEIWLMNAHNKASRILHRDERLRGMVPLPITLYAGSQRLIETRLTRWLGLKSRASRALVSLPSSSIFHPRSCARTQPLESGSSPPYFSYLWSISKMGTRRAPLKGA
ncbi:BZ3500_MvSof-1268-A1-R1_Chr1-1g01246 [Microbotryum saponariae]|uniref:BZ3500_MvSof-1268-A1-R1_Chr1-1g01246 protein n=1 Tax=Microbotryum saponariae TaxID=289078 RepID=A0A2X0K8V7_9BASI|nr:BZ3500_MvSof-1268-A1-R1_Chr1-1g01246 [Microbotryum saponariae]SCZ93774.1 BZ3501_MvSof-1269-A2-R1_Chr1-1g00842 [Microbotryum saponariae]